MDKGQAFLSDFTVSIAVFSIIVAAFFIPWNSIIEAENRFSEAENMKTDARRTAAFLVSTGGYPSNWEQDDVSVNIPGFASSDNILSTQKIREFSEKSYDAQTSLLKTQEFSLEFYDPNTGILLGNGSEFGDDQTNRLLGRAPVAYVVQSGSSFSSLEMLDDLNNSGIEWHFYFPSEENSDQLDSLTAKRVYTNDGAGAQMMERAISDSTDKGWNKFRIGEKISVAVTSEIADIDGDERNEVFYRDTNDRLNLYDLQTQETTSIDTVTGLGRLGAVDNFTSEEGLELAFVDSNDQLAFYNYELDSVTVTSQGAIDVGDAATVSGRTAVFFTDDNNNLAYYSQENGVTTTSANSGRIGGVGDVDTDSGRELAYINGNDNLAYYSLDAGSSEATSEQSTDVGWINEGLTAIVSNSNGYSGTWNYSSSTFSSTGAQSQSVADFREVGGRDLLFYVDTEQDQDLTVYDTGLGLKRYLRADGGESIRAQDGGWKVSIPGYGEAFAFQGGNGYLSFYSRSEETVLYTGIQVQHVGGAGDLDGDDSEEIVFVDNANGNLDYYDFQQGEEVVATDGGSNVRGSDVGEPADVDGDGRDEAVFQDGNFLAYYDYQDNQVTDWSSVGQVRFVGGSSDIDREGNPEIFYASNSNNNLWYYDPLEGENTDTGKRVESYIGGAADVTGNPQKEIIYRNGDQRIAYYNPATGTSTEETIRINGAGDALSLNSDEGADAVMIDSNDRLGYFDFSLAPNYDTLIAENTAVQPGNIDNGEILKSGVEEGMTYLHSRNSVSVLTDIFGMNDQDPGSNTAEIQEINPLLNNESFAPGDDITFSNVQEGFQNVETVFANTSSGSCLACMQKFGDGKVYYLADTSAGSDQTAFTDPGEIIISSLKNPFNIGTDVRPEAETTVVVDRSVVINRSGELQKAELRYKLWR